MQSWYTWKHVDIPAVKAKCWPLIQEVGSRDFILLVDDFVRGAISQFTFYFNIATQYATPEAAVAGKCVVVALTGEA